MTKRYGHKTSATRHKPGTGRFTEGKTEVTQISEEQLKKLKKKRKDNLKGPLQQS